MADVKVEATGRRAPERAGGAKPSRSLVSHLVWFCGLWLFGVVSLGIVAAILRWAIH